MGSVTALTPADLLTMGRPPDGKHYELTDAGELVVVGNAGPIHELVKAEDLWHLITAVPRATDLCSQQLSLRFCGGLGFRTWHS